MPLALAPFDEELTIKRLGGNPEVRKHLEDLGFHVGCTVMLVTGLNGNLIIKVKDARVAISEEMAKKIYI